MSKGMRTEDEVRDSAKLVLGFDKTIEACRKANGIRTSEIIGDHGHFPEPAPHGMPPEPCHEHPHN